MKLATRICGSKPLGMLLCNNSKPQIDLQFPLPASQNGSLTFPNKSSQLAGAIKQLVFLRECYASINRTPVSGNDWAKNETL